MKIMMEIWIWKSGLQDCQRFWGAHLKNKWIVSFDSCALLILFYAYKKKSINFEDNLVKLIWFNET